MCLNELSGSYSNATLQVGFHFACSLEVTRVTGVTRVGMGSERGWNGIGKGLEWGRNVVAKGSEWGRKGTGKGMEWGRNVVAKGSKRGRNGFRRCRMREIVGHVVVVDEIVYCVLVMKSYFVYDSTIPLQFLCERMLSTSNVDLSSTSRSEYLQTHINIMLKTLVIY